MRLQNKIVSFLFLFLLINLNNLSFAQTLLKGGVSTYKFKDKNIKVDFKAPVNYYFSLPGDKVYATISEDIKISESFSIPKGSQFIGIISDIKDPQRFGIDGNAELQFNTIKLPNGEEISIQAKASTNNKSKSEQVAEILTYDSALIGLGSFHGALAGVQLGGISLAISSHGISVASGAAVGAACGIIGSMYRKGKIPTVSAIKASEIKFSSDVSVLGNHSFIHNELLTAEKKEDEYKGFRFSESLKTEDLKVTIKSVEKQKQKNYGIYSIITFDLKNNSNKKISLGHFILANEREKVHPDVFLSGASAVKMINPNDELSVSLAYLVKDPNKYNLVLVDLLDDTEIIKVSLDR